MKGTVVCGIDDSDKATGAAGIAAALAEKLELRLVLVHVTEPLSEPAAAAGHAWAPAISVPSVEADRSAREAGTLLLERVARAVGVTDGAELRLEVGTAALEVCELAEDEGAALIVLGSHGRGALRAALLGSVSNTVVMRARCPVVVVPDAPTGWHLHTIVCAVADSEGAHGPVRTASRLADRLGARLVLLHVAPSANLAGVSARPEARSDLVRAERRDAEQLLAHVAFEHGLGTGVVRRVAFGDPVDGVRRSAAEEDAGLIVVGSRRRGTLAAALLGSVSSALATGGPCPVVVAPGGTWATFDARS